MRLQVAIELQAPTPSLRAVALAVWRSMGLADADEEVRLRFAWAALGLCLPIGPRPDASGWDLMAYGLAVQGRLEELGTDVTPAHLAEAIQLALAGVVAVSGEKAVRAAVEMPASAHKRPQEPLPGAPVEELQAYHAALVEYNATRTA